MDPGLARDVLTALAGVATGALSGMFGVGGAVISTPAVRALGLSAALSVGTTLPAIIPGAASGTLRYLRAGLIDWRVVRWAGPAGAASAVGGSLLAKVTPGDGHLLMLLTAALLGFSAVRMARPGVARAPSVPLVGRAETDSEVADEDLAADTGTLAPMGPPRPAALLAVGAVAGLLSGLLGVGGGIVMVPGFMQMGRMDLKRAIATSLACVAMFAVPGTLTHWAQGDIEWRFALLLALGVIPGARLGAALTLRADDRRLRLLVAAFLGLTAVVYGLGELISLASA